MFSSLFSILSSMCTRRYVIHRCVLSAGPGVEKFASIGGDEGEDLEEQKFSMMKMQEFSCSLLRGCRPKWLPGGLEKRPPEGRERSPGRLENGPPEAEKCCTVAFLGDKFFRNCGLASK